MRDLARSPGGNGKEGQSFNQRKEHHLKSAAACFVMPATENSWFTGFWMSQGLVLISNENREAALSFGCNGSILFPCVDTHTVVEGCTMAAYWVFWVYPK
jgi:hypothetical protein